MSLLDLSSDLSKFRSVVKSSAPSTPENSKATTPTNFGSFQPISERLSSFAPKITKPSDVPLESRLTSTRLDDAILEMKESMLLNSVSRYSPLNTKTLVSVNTGGNLENITSKFSEIPQREFVSQLDKSDVLVIRAERGTNNLVSPTDVSRFVEGSNNLVSPTDVNESEVGTNNLVSPTDVNLSEEGTNNLVSPTDVLPDTYGTNNLSSFVDVNESISGQNNLTSPLDIKPIPDDASDNITNPDIGINTIPLSLDRSGQSVQINTDLLSPINNVINPDVALLPTTLTFDRTGQSPQILTDTVKQGLVVDPDTQVLRMENGTFHLNDESRLNRDGQPIRFVTTSRLAERTLPREIDAERYDGQSQQLRDNSRLNLDGVTKTNPTGRHENPDESRLSIIGTQEVNFFQDTDAKGFIVRAQKGQTQYTGQSEFTWFGNPPSTNFITDINGKGFQTFAQPLQTSYETESSILGFTNIPETDFFDITKQHTSEGFKSFVLSLQSAYKPDSSVFGWVGKREQAPTTNYFDLQGTSTTDGFHKFAQLLDSKYVIGASQFDWDGNRDNAPEVNYFDISGNHTTTGFHKFASLYDTKYIPESSRFDWDGTRQNAPETNYFDLNGQHTTTGFHKFAQVYDTKYIPDSSIFDWDGASQNAPEVNYFDLSSQYSTAGFHKFAQVYDTKYIPESSRFDWDGNSQTSPEVNYFDISGKNTTKGFHRFAQVYDTKYIPNSSIYDWDGGRQNAPEVNYFDISGQHTTTGFHKFASIYDSKFIKDSSIYDWDGGRQQAPETNFFQNTNASGFTKFAQSLQSEYSPESSNFTFTGTTPNPVDYFLNTNASGFTIKTTPLETKYVSDSSNYTFKGDTQGAPNVDFFTNDVNTGFTTFARQFNSEYKSDASRFTFKGNSQQAPAVDFITNTFADGFNTFARSLETRYKSDVSSFTWKGNRQQSPEVNFFYIPNENPDAVAGFTKFFTDKTETKLSDQYSRLSFAGTTVRSAIRPVPYTTFFGYTPSERSGFMVDMTTFDGTLYPNLSPLLTYNADQQTRYGVEQLRALRGGMTTENNEKYAPKSLGPRPWIDGTISATLENQIPLGQLITGAEAGSYINKYEKTLKDTTNRVGYLTKWATTRNSDSPLDTQYKKFSLQQDSVNSEPAFFFQPYVVRGIQRDGEVENQRWGFDVAFDDGLIRGGAVTHAERLLADTTRLGKWTASVKGGLFNVKQLGLQAMNPVVDVDPKTPTSGILGVSSTLIYNPLSLLANVASAPLGVHLARHGLVPFDSDYLNKYEKATRNRELNSIFTSPEYKSFDGLTSPSIVDIDPSGQSGIGGYNRLIGLMKELLPGSFKPVVAPSNSDSPDLRDVANAAIDLANDLTGKAAINRLSSNFGGAQSILGIGGTTIRRAGHPYLTHYTTSPLLMLTGEQKQPQYLSTAKRDTYYSATSMYKDYFSDIIGGMLERIVTNVENGPYNLNGENAERNTDNIENVQPQTVNRIINKYTFQPGYDSIASRARPTDEFSLDKVGDLSKELHPQALSTINPIKQYRAASYDKLSISRDRKRARNQKTDMGAYNDFRADLELDETTKKFISDPSVVNYAENNLEDRFGFGKHGEVGVNRDKPFINTISYGKSKLGFAIPQVKDQNAPFRGDRINIIDYKRSNFDLSKDSVYEVGTYNNANLPGAEDLVEFYFTGLTLSGTKTNPAEAIVFRSTFGNISDSHNADWQPIKYIGRADPIYLYQGYEREITFDFTVHVGSRDEMKAVWRKLNHLSSWTAPQYTKGGFIKAPIIRLNIGNLYRKMPGFLGTITYDFDNTEGTWETAKLRQDQFLEGPDAAATSPGVLQLPKTVKVNCSFTPIGVYRPEYNGIMYSLYDDSAGGQLENGLVPNNDVRVNYFKTFDVNESGQSEAFDSADNMDYYSIKMGQESVVPEINPTQRETAAGSETAVNTNNTTEGSSVPELRSSGPVVHSRSEFADI